MQMSPKGEDVMNLYNFLLNFIHVESVYFYIVRTCFGNFFHFVRLNL